MEDLRTDDAHQRDIRVELLSELLADMQSPLPPYGIHITNARLIGPSDLDYWSLNSFSLPVGIEFRHCWFEKGIRAHDARLPWFHLDDCLIPYFQADRLVVQGSLFLRGLRTTNPEEERVRGGARELVEKAEEDARALWLGSVRLLGARIGRNLELDAACLHNPYGPALHAEGIGIGRALRIRTACVEAACETGAIQLVNARVGGDAWIDGTHIRNTKGPALNAEGLQVDGSLLLSAGFTATAASPELATVHLMSSRVGSRLDLSSGRRNTGDIWPSKAHDHKLAIQESPAVVNNSHRSRLTLDLGCASTNELRLPPEAVCSPRKRRCTTGKKIIIVGMKYTTLSKESAHRHWTHWLSHHVERFDAEPYHHLAATLRGSGRAREARDLLIDLENERHRRRSGPPHLGASAWHWIKRGVIGHGYKPGRALYFLLGVFISASILTISAQAAHLLHKPAVRVEGPTAAAPTTTASAQARPDTEEFLTTAKKSDDEDSPCPFGAAVRLAADLSVPLFTTNGRLGCDFKVDDPRGSTLATVGLLLQVLGWVFGTLFVVGFTGVIRRE
ncbi:hypothetical protein [Saccharothrix variisporea]|uniref:Uncharacterized protein n=1 Tax=Saccharothrix variisporea TaxID=543527 RepID=A0A495XRS6_9PSEU|nr:hypothetical protein [Saccharothrix variisporea]RKT74368.1 hypothetical protein DFJ66_7713 [Saccharothrix variisporea]